ncbi:hypothetical protein ACIA8C_30345 [Nocardia sp. NPDC051321]|uniref:hypothetical protein n=1 Tax=Nocardia sp. NPDC051321 TaxID=3364323 RepID=UPI0037A79392
MSVLRGIVVGAVIGAATLIGAGAAGAATLQLEPAAPAAESVAKDCTGVIHPIGQLVCTLSSLSG